MDQHKPSKELLKVFNKSFSPIIEQLQAASEENAEKNIGFALVVISNEEDFLNFSIFNASDKSIRSISKEFNKLCPPIPLPEKRFNLLFPN
ncbi:MAG: hypothetical protein V4549_07620 [Bacteroidota bacterium]